MVKIHELNGFSARVICRNNVIKYLLGTLTIALLLIIYITVDQFGTQDKKYGEFNPVTSYGRSDISVDRQHSWLNGSLCNVDCTTGSPCTYQDELDFRIIVLTYNRPESLKKCLHHIFQLDTLGDKVGVNIWIDRGKDGTVNERIVNIASTFANSWAHGRGCYHLQSSNAYITGQWIDTWHPKPHTKEMALILEDDIDISRYSYKWLKLVRARYGQHPNLAGYTLHMENVIYAKEPPNKVSPHVHGPVTDSVYFYELMSTWGFIPNPDFWRKFQRWYHLQIQDPAFHPYIPGVIMTGWYKGFEAKGTEKSMWEMWFLYFCFVHDRWTLYPNFPAYTGREDILLLTNRLEAGLHYSSKLQRDHSNLLLDKWDKALEKFPEQVTILGYDGQPRTDVE